ncbi:DEP domain-containing protein 1A [Xenopus laevis]|uniref:DEP domain-containing protein 1A n=2 Tax=Xenopus laevis TaxID=8355 RepID=DEP1A_XENLA|nr:DEP domain-containing protein 1A [Xenopus laevis]Q6ING4.1 RecName: Full=DEP domain-containing protein 1A [Xenopus laevis]AAH72317.1 MGC82699 protein [Xenopus laevis]
MDSRIITPGPYRATKLWNEVTKHFRAAMPLRKHRQHFKAYGNCFTASEAIDWLHQLLKTNSNFGSEVTRQQTIQLLRKFLKNHVIEDLKGRWGTEELEDNNSLYRFPSTSPVKTIPSRPPLWKRSSLENVFKEKEHLFKMPQFSKKTPKRRASVDSKEEQENEDLMEDQRNDDDFPKQLSSKDIEDIWGNITMIHLQKILGLPSLEEVLNPAQIKPNYIRYNMTNTSKHGVVVLQDKTDDLPHWVLSAMKCLANWPKNNDMSQATYIGFERDVFRTVADYFLNLPEPLLTFEFYELFVNILVVCGYITVPNSHNGKHRFHNKTRDPAPAKKQHLNDEQFFKSTECLLLSLVRKVPNEEEDDVEHSFGEIARDNKDHIPRDVFAKKNHLYGSFSRRASRGTIGGSCQNLSTSRKETGVTRKVRVRSCSLEGIADSVSTDVRDCQSNILQPSSQKPEFSVVKERPITFGNQAESVTGLNASEHKLHYRTSDGGYSQTSEKLARSVSVGDCLESRTSKNAPVAEITIKPLKSKQTRMQKRFSPTDNEPTDLDFTVTKRLCQSTMELSHSSFPSTSSLLPPTTSPNSTGSESLLQPHLEKVAIEALQLCCLLLPPANRRKLQLLMRMISRMSQNVDMPRLHDAMGTRSLMIQTFSRCVLCCAEEVDLDELLASRLVSFLMDHHQDILQVPCYLQTAVQDHVQYLQRPRVKQGTVPEYYFCKQISAQEFEEQRLATSQAAIMELLENIVRDKALAVKDKKKKLKQFQKQYPDIYQSRFPTTESEAKLFGDKPTIKQPMLMLKKPKFKSLRY